MSTKRKDWTKRSKKAPEESGETAKAVAAVVTDADRELFWKCVRDGDTRDGAWSLVRKAFPRERFAKVRDAAAALTEFRTFTAAFKRVRGDDAALSHRTTKTKAVKKAKTTKRAPAKKASRKGGAR